jgi:hypothetical protein
MDPRLEQIFADQRRLRFPGLSGSEFGGTIRISDRLLNELVAAGLPADGPVRSLQLRSREGNWLDATVTLARPKFMPPLHVELAIDAQPELPHNPVVALRLAGGAAAVFRMVSSAISHAVALPPGVRIDADRVRIDLRMALERQGRGALLDHVQQICVATEEAGLAIIVLAKI